VAEEKTIPREKWIPEIPFDVAVWGDKPDPYPDGLFENDAAFQAARERAAEKPRPEPPGDDRLR